MADIVYNEGLNALYRGFLGDLNGTANLKCKLYTASYTPNKDDAAASITGEVANGNGYTTGGQALTGVTVTNDTANDRVMLDATDPSWAASTITARYAVIVFDSTTDYLLYCLDFGANVSSTNGTFTVQFGANGISLTNQP